MYCTRKVTNDLIWVGGNDRRLSVFEGVYSVPDGVSYNSYLLLDEKTVVFDTVDKAVQEVFFQNVKHELGDRKLDYLVIHHMEPDHSASVEELLLRYPDMKIICNAMTKIMLGQFFEFDVAKHVNVVAEGETLCTGKHTFAFVNAPMVHWPEVMMTYDTTDKILFSADAFGTFGALNGALFADEVNFERDYMDEARRYYTNIVGKYGSQVQSILKKAADLDIEMICPLHGFVWRSNLGMYIEKYLLWSSYEPEETGVVIAYASVYGHTANAADIIAARLRDKGIKTVVFDTSITPASDIISAVFKYSHLVLASTTYNAHIFVRMEEFLRDLAAHNIQKRTVAIVENGTWAATSGGLMREILAPLTDMTILNEQLSIKSALKLTQDEEINTLVEAVAGTVKLHSDVTVSGEATVDQSAMFKLSYGLFLLSARDGGFDNACIINTTAQLTDTPKRISITVNKQNKTHDMILKTGVFNVSVLSEDAPFKLFEQFGFKSGASEDKFAGFKHAVRSANGLLRLDKYANSFMSGKVISTIDLGTHTLFIADVTEAKVINDEISVTYAYYFENIKPKPHINEEKPGYICKICGYFHEGEELPDDFICPLCKHGAEDFERVGF